MTGGRWRRYLAFVFLLLPALTSAENPLHPYSEYLDQTVSGLQRVRGANGLPVDAVLVGRDGSLRPRHDVAELTSPTNVGIDLMLQIDLLDYALYRERARAAITQVVDTLAQEPFHPASGLFYNWYLTQGIAVAQRDVSSIDNLHLALGLWSVARRLTGTPAGQTAARLFQRMDFSPFVDRNRGVLGGNLHFIADGQWTLDEFRYDYFGSETRSLYTAGAAIGIHGVDRAFLEAAVDKLTFEMATPYGKRILRTWDGGTFQLFLPELLLGESQYSTQLREIFAAYADFAWREGERRRLPLPATHSACVIGLDPFSDDPIPEQTRVKYFGQEGSRAVGNRQATQVFDDSAVAIHAVLMAATADPVRYLAPLSQLKEKLASAPVPLYRPELGFVDSVSVQDRVGRADVTALPVVLALDKEMEALALLHILSPDHSTASARLLAVDPETRGELTRYYQLVDKRLASATSVD